MSVNHVVPIIEDKATGGDKAQVGS